MISSKDKIIENNILTTKEACKLLRISRSPLENRLSTKREPGKIYAKKVGGAWRFQKKDIYRYLNEVRFKYVEEKMEDDILNFSEVCKLLRISQPTLNRILCDRIEPGKIFGRKLGRGRIWRITRKEIYRYLNEEE